MDPISAISLASNIIDLVSKAARGGAAVVEVYKSVSGLSNANEVLSREAASLRGIVADLRRCQSQSPDNTANQRMRHISATLLQQCVELQSTLDDCRSTKRWGVLSAGRASATALLKISKIQKLQSDIVGSRDELFRWIATSTRPASSDVEATLRQLKAISTTSCEIATTLQQVNARLDVAAHNPTACLRGIRDIVANRVILQLLNFPSFHNRFEEIATQEEGTYEWIFAEPHVVLESEPELATTFPSWLESGDGIFHICGKPGSGKSTLMKYICRNPTTANLLSLWSRDNKLLIGKFFFWRTGVPQEQKSIRGLIRGLLYQILCEVPELSGEIFSQEIRYQLVENLQKHTTAELNSDDIMEAFSRLVTISKFSNPSQSLRGLRICLFIDGLDEFDNTIVNQSYRGLVEKLCQWTKNSDGHVKICVSSRTQEPFMQMLDSSKRFTLEKITGGDIELFIKRNLEDYPKFQRHHQKSPKECQALVNNIRRSADGVFLYVALAVKTLQDGLDDGIPVRGLRKVVSTTPEDLNSLLERVMGDVHEAFRDGLDVLLSAMLRATGTLLSPEDRASIYVKFSESSYEDLNISVLGSFFILRAIDTTATPVWDDLTIDKFDVRMEEWFQDGMGPDEISKVLCNTVRARCSGGDGMVGPC
ncbi:hypothetical protein ONZ43_g1076 [Nemania bipapillata]|uniref:Uncharacterized protein n=1 Tax=Nemania bipapillata TaxID=110536 RepID=A0ACC2J658_9PEZI|nr:hypothetical protein ONZ43_g1076 [Nemania bipapillata]